MNEVRMKAAFHTLGCKVNQYETEALIEQFRAAGYDIVGENETADVYVVNTCTVTHVSDRKSRQYIRRMKNRNPDAVIAVTGCYVQVSPEEVAAIPEVDILAGTNEKSRLAGYIGEFLAERRRQVHILSYDELDYYDETGTIQSMESKTRAYIKIQEGCNRFCSYCIIPYARGNVRSRKPSDILKEARSLIDAGFREVVLTGINTALYGTEEGFVSDVSDEHEKTLYGIEKIIYLLDRMEGDFRIRLSSLEPTVVDKDYVRRLLKYDRLCHHLHLSVQSGSDHVLSMMNRKYSRNDYLEIVDVLRECDSEYGITTDIIAGFPGETEEDFEDSLKMADEAGFLRIHAFPYSRRRGTAAYDMENQIPEDIKKERTRRLIDRGSAVSEGFLRRNIGTIRRVLIEEILDNSTAVGYTDNYIKVYVDNYRNEPNMFCDVYLTGLYKDGLSGEIYDKE
ncbi:MAG: tRNA (N(6)-L-threonylcarbamoyladenosine(37)-C(2))-methylthiotransferase MtaB [Anaerovoracaceae bacterium]